MICAECNKKASYSVMEDYKVVFPIGEMVITWKYLCKVCYHKGLKE